MPGGPNILIISIISYESEDLKKGIYPFNMYTIMHPKLHISPPLSKSLLGWRITSGGLMKKFDS